jgi:hypothetical protein
MVDLHWIADRLIKQEKAKQVALWRRKYELPMPMDFTTKFQFNGYNVEVTEQFKDTVHYAEWLKKMEELGFSKPVYANRSREVKEGVLGKVVSVAVSAKTFGNGKKMYDVTCDLSDGTKLVVGKFSPTEYRNGDKIVAFKNEAGYQDIKLDLYSEMGDADNIPF